MDSEASESFETRRARGAADRCLAWQGEQPAVLERSEAARAGEAVHYLQYRTVQYSTVSNLSIVPSLCPGDLARALQVEWAVLYLLRISPQLRGRFPRWSLTCGASRSTAPVRSTCTCAASPGLWCNTPYEATSPLIRKSRRTAIASSLPLPPSSALLSNSSSFLHSSFSLLLPA